MIIHYGLQRKCASLTILRGGNVAFHIHFGRANPLRKFGVPCAFESRQGIVLLGIHTETHRTIVLFGVYFLVYAEIEDVFFQYHAMLFGSSCRCFGKVVGRAVGCVLAENVAEIVGCYAHLVVIFRFQQAVYAVTLRRIDAQTVSIYWSFERGNRVPRREVCRLWCHIIGNKSKARLSHISAPTVVYRIVHNLLTLSYLQHIGRTGNVRRLSHGKIGTQRYRKTVAGVVLQLNVHCHIVGENLSFQCLNGLVVLYYFRLFHVLCLYVFGEFVVPSVAKVEPFHRKATDILSVYAYLSIASDVHARQFCQYIFQRIVSF